MATEAYLAMRSEDFISMQQLPPKIAWMACHFSSSGPGLSGLPASLPPGSLLIVDDQLPIRGHDPSMITAQLKQAVNNMNCAGVLLDFERPGIPEQHVLAEHLASSLPCPVAISDLYAGDIDCPVFLPPCPHHVHLAEHIAAWAGREIWLDLARNAEIITITPSASTVSSYPWSDMSRKEHSDNKLCCHYYTELAESHICFILHRTKDDMVNLMQEAETCGVQTCVGLYQEWK